MDQETKILGLFGQTANTIADQIFAEIETLTILRGKKPTFEELMEKLKHLDKNLTEKAVMFVDIYKKETGKPADELTEGLKKIVTQTIEGFVKKL